MISPEEIAGAMSYETYKNLLEKLLSEGKTTGHTQSQEYLEYAKINLQRMGRIEKTTVIENSLKNLLNSITGHYYWVIITEGWCGDASQNLPVLHAIEKTCPNIELKILLRDDNISLMNQYLTNGSRSIPKLIAVEKNSLNQLFVWGPRPEALQARVLEMVKNGVSKQEKGLATQKWYNEDKTKSLQLEIEALIKKFMN